MKENDPAGEIPAPSNEARGQRPTHEQIFAFVRGRLPPEQQADVEQYVLHHPEVRSTIAIHRHLTEVLDAEAQRVPSDYGLEKVMKSIRTPRLSWWTRLRSWLDNNATRSIVALATIGVLAFGINLIGPSKKVNPPTTEMSQSDAEAKHLQEKLLNREKILELEQLIREASEDNADQHYRDVLARLDPLERRMIIMTKDANTFALDKNARKRLRKLADVITSGYVNYQIVVVEVNALSSQGDSSSHVQAERRATFVANYLVEQGIPRSKVREGTKVCPDFGTEKLPPACMRGVEINVVEKYPQEFSKPPG